MKKLCKNLSLALVCFGGFGLTASFAQDTKTDNHTVSINIPEVALLDIELAAGKNITMNFTAPTEAGNPIVAPSNNTALWLNYSSIVEASGADASRTVTVSASAVIPGVDIKVTAGNDAGAGAGATGTPAGAAITLTTSPQEIISGIGSCWTGNEASKGHPLTYEVSLKSDYNNLVASSNTITVTYTLSAN